MPYYTVVPLYMAAFILKLLKISVLRLVVIAISAEIMTDCPSALQRELTVPRSSKGASLKEASLPQPHQSSCLHKEGYFQYLPVLVPQAGYLFCIHRHKTALEEEIKPVFFPSG